MATNNKVPFGYGGPVPKGDDEGAPAPAETSCNKCSCGERVVGTAALVLVCLVLTFIVITAVKPSYGGLKGTNIEVKRFGDLESGLTEAMEHERFDELAAAQPEVRGREFWSLLFKDGLMEPRLLGKLVSLYSAVDSKPDKEWITTSKPMPANSCSYTAPKLGELREVMQLRGESRVVLFTFNSRNWENCGDEGLLVQWSDVEVPVFVTFDEIAEKYGITAEEWADPAGRLFGKKAPFQFTYE